MVPLVEQENLIHLWKNADPTFRFGSQNVNAVDVSEVSAKLEYGWDVFVQFNSMLRILGARWKPNRPVTEFQFTVWIHQF